MTENVGPRNVGTLVTDQLRRVEVAMLSRVLTETLAKALPPAMVDVERRRSPLEWLTRKPGVAIGVTVKTDERELTYRSPDVGVVDATVTHIVRGVVISRKPVSPAAWLDALTAVLDQVADDDERTRQSLRRVLLD